MGPPTSASGKLQKVSAAAKVASFSAGIVDSKKPFAVVAEDGAILGEVTPAAVIDLLAGRDREARL